MSEIEIHLFGKISLPFDQEYINTIFYKGVDVSLDLNNSTSGETLNVPAENLLKVDAFLKNFSKIENHGREEIYKDFVERGDVFEYLEWFADIIREQEIEGIVNFDLKSPKESIATLYLKRVGFYPWDTEEFAVLDYTANNKIMDHMIVLYMSSEGKLSRLTIES